MSKARVREDADEHDGENDEGAEEPAPGPPVARAALGLVLAGAPGFYAVSAMATRLLRGGGETGVPRSVVLEALASTGVAAALAWVVVRAVLRRRAPTQPLSRVTLGLLAASATLALVQSEGLP